MKNVIFDTDGGGDDLWALLLLADAHKSGKINLMGITTCFGNTSLENASNNILNFLYYCGASDIPVFKGADRTLNGLRGLADNAFGSNGLSDGSLPQSDQSLSDISAHDFLVDTLSKNNEKLSIISTGPATNIARVFRDYPEFDQDNIDLLWMAGADRPAGGDHQLIIKDEETGRHNQGNITEYMEFNAGNDVPASNILVNLKNVQVTIMPMDPCQHTVIGNDRLNDLAQSGNKDFSENLFAFLQNVMGLDKLKQGMDGTPIYDAQTVQYYFDSSLFPTVTSLDSVSFEDKSHLVQSFLDASDAGEYRPGLLDTHGLMTIKTIQNGQTSNIKIVSGPYTGDSKPTPEQLNHHIQYGEKRTRDLIKRASQIIRL